MRNKKLLIGLLLSTLIILIGGGIIFSKKKIEPKQSTGINCGGWDTFGEVVCECSGPLEKFTCPTDTVCDSGFNTCDGICGECKCYSGSAQDGTEIPCDGRDQYFK